MKKQEKHSNFERPVLSSRSQLLETSLLLLKAFTLVELIVVITIVAILGTIVFISLQGYSSSAKNSTRVSDLSSMKTSLELFNLDAGKYPNPTDGFDVTYSGSIVWTQGTFGETTKSNVEKLDKIPRDPLTNNEYTYSLANNKVEYQLGAMMELGGESSYNLPIIQKTNAVTTKTATAFVTGTYNEKIIKVSTGTTSYILAVPSIINADLDYTDLQEIITKKQLVYNNYSNLPSSYEGKGYTMIGGFEFIPSTDLVVYSGSMETLGSNGIIQQQFIENLQSVYQDTIISSTLIIQEIIKATTPEQKQILAGNYINNHVGGIIGKNTAVISPIYSCTGSLVVANATITNTGGLTSDTNYQISDNNGLCYFSCNIGYILDGNNCVALPCEPGYGWNGSTCILANTCISGISEITLANGQTWSCMNLGATTVWDGLTQPAGCGGSLVNCNSSLTWIGDYYQWGRNDIGWTNGQSQAPYYYGWEPDDSNKWGGIGTTTTAGTWQTQSIENRLLMRGNCSTGRHIPTTYEWKLACNTISGNNCINNSTTSIAMKNILKLPFAGYRSWSTGGYADGGGVGYYGSSSPAYGYGGAGYPDDYMLNFGTSYIVISDKNFRSQGYSIRCIKN